MVCNNKPAECAEHNYCARNDECFESKYRKTLASIDYKYLRPRVEVVVFPSHDIVDNDPLPVVMSEREADDITWEWAYYRGYKPADYPVPAVVVRTGFVPSGGNGMRGIPYIWLMYGYNKLTTFWKDHDTVVEWYDTDGNRRLKREVSMSHKGSKVNEG